MFKHIKEDLFNPLSEDINCVVERDPAARSKIEVFLCYPGVHALIFYRISHYLWKKNFFTTARIISSFARFLTGVDIHPASRIGRRLFIDHATGLVIGETAEIGNDVTLYHGVTLGGTTTAVGKRHPTICNRVIVGAGAKLLGPITIADDARIGSNAVVLKDVPAGATAVGVPARIICKESKAQKTHAFCAYGAEDNLIDPLSQMMDCLKQEMQSLEKQIKILKEQKKPITKKKNKKDI